jgi:N6-L-threonylcarbamoyladenine synthase
MMEVGNHFEYLLGIETSCDETSAAVITPHKVLSNIISSQSVHVQFGGVVPELASRAHLSKILPIVEEALQSAHLTLPQLSGLVVTHGPGLIGALLVGLNYVKGLSLSLNIPYVAVNHIEGHIYANFLDDKSLPFPFLCLIVSGGHTQIVLIRDHLQYQIVGETRDDAAGEAFDKVAKLLNLSYPGGPAIDLLASKGSSAFIEFPRALMKSDQFDFSYSGLKTAVMNYLRELGQPKVTEYLSDICASFQRAAVEPLVKKTVQAARTYQVRTIALAGGVAANSLLRSWMTDEAARFNLKVFFPRLEFCTDNAAMIARAGLQYLLLGQFSPLDTNAYPSLRLGEVL